MNTQNEMPDLAIISMIEQNETIGWKNLYDKYALTMYVPILWIVDDEIFAKNILSQLFSQLKMDKKLLSTKRTLCASLLQYTYVTTYKMLRATNAMISKQSKHNDVFSMLNELIYKPYPLMAVAKTPIIEKERGIERLCTDLNQLAYKKLRKTKPRLVAPI